MLLAHQGCWGMLKVEYKWFHEFRMTPEVMIFLDKAIKMINLEQNWIDKKTGFLLVRKLLNKD
jgi:hypothetical protein